MIKIRKAVLRDAKKLLQIYDYYVKNTAVTFECVSPTLDEFTARMEDIMKRYPYFVVLKDDKIAGYAYANSFSAREAYDWSCELTVYIAHDLRRCGLGKMLYNALEKALYEMGILNLYACVAYPIKEDEYLTCGSANFHMNSGFERVGEFYKCGNKFGNWYNIIWMQKIIGSHKENHPKIKNFSDL